MNSNILYRYYGSPSRIWWGALFIHLFKIAEKNDFLHLFTRVHAPCTQQRRSSVAIANVTAWKNLLVGTVHSATSEVVRHQIHAARWRYSFEQLLGCSNRATTARFFTTRDQWLETCRILQKFRAHGNIVNRAFRKKSSCPMGLLCSQITKEIQIDVVFNLGAN